MAYKDILLVVDNTPACAERTRLALALARRYSAHLVGLLVRTPPQIPAYAAAQIPAEFYDAQRQAAELGVAEAKRRFEDAASAAGASSEWRQAVGAVDVIATLHARYADLLVVGQTEPERLGELGTCSDLAAHLALDAGRPVLVVPYVGKFELVGRNIMIAWNGGRESARAVADALPLLKDAQRVMTLALNPKSGSEAGSHSDLPGADIALHLARHDVKIDAAQVVTKDVSVADMLLSRAADQGVDLLVMGAYGRSRFRELVLGGVTRSISQHMTLPVLMSH